MEGFQPSMGVRLAREINSRSLPLHIYKETPNALFIPHLFRASISAAVTLEVEVSCRRNDVRSVSKIRLRPRDDARGVVAVGGRRSQYRSVGRYSFDLPCADRPLPDGLRSPPTLSSIYTSLAWSLPFTAISWALQVHIGAALEVPPLHTWSVRLLATR